MKISFTQESKISVNRGRIGLFIEDINYAIDGGLNAEVLENGNFEATSASGVKDSYTVVSDGIYAWEPLGEATLKVKTDRSLFPENIHYMRVEAVAGAGMTNRAYEGVFMQGNVKYRVSFYARSYNYKGKAQVAVLQEGAAAVFDTVKLKPDGKWRRYEVTLKSKSGVRGGAFAFTLLRAGIVHVDCFSMIPENAVLGVFRRDLVGYMKELKPGFLRFPGGCIVEGNTLSNRYLWKNSVGMKERRTHNWNRWAVHCAENYENNRTPYSHYGQSLGVGYFEYFRLAEYLGAKPFPVVNVGMACQYQSTEIVPIDSAEFEAYVQDALDAVEFALGGTDTVWGAVRAEMGHPQPFALEYLGVGNEQWQEVNAAGKDNEFQKRFEIFEQRIHEKYPDLKIIGTTGPDVDSKTHRAAWDWIYKKCEENPAFVYAVDEHFYVPPQWLYENVHRYDAYPRSVRVCAGEFAAHVLEAGAGKENRPECNSWEGALAEAAFMTGMEQNSDVVVMAAYAPLFARLGYAQWSPDLIWFDAKKSYATPSYYVQQMYSLYTGDTVYRTATDGAGVYASCSERDGMFFVKAVNATDGEVTAEIDADFDFGVLTRILSMSGAREDCNSIDKPLFVAPTEIAPAEERTVTLKPHSFSVLVFIKQGKTVDKS